MIGSGHTHGIDLVAHGVQHLAEILEAPGFGIATEGSATRAPVDIAQCCHRCARAHDTGDVAVPLAADSDCTEPDGITGRGETAAQHVPGDDVKGGAGCCYRLYETAAVGHFRSP
jgi:hypothetical protein